MSHFLVFYDRGRQGEPEVKRIEDSNEAVAALLEAEHDLAGDPERGVVMLVADDIDDLRRTHAHYFASSVEDLLHLPVA
jgi:hypothetical protein